MKCKRCQESFSFWRWLFHNCKTYRITNDGFINANCPLYVSKVVFKEKPTGPPCREIKESGGETKESIQARIDGRLKNLTSKEIVDNTIEFCNGLDRQGGRRDDTFFGKHNDEISKKERELFGGRYPPYLKIKTFKLKK